MTLMELLRRAEIEWHGVALNHPDWSDHSHSIAFTLRSLVADLMMDMDEEEEGCLRIELLGADFIEIEGA